jgi:hypothetical protein
MPGRVYIDAEMIPDLDEVSPKAPEEAGAAPSKSGVNRLRRQFTVSLTVAVGAGLTPGVPVPVTVNV